MSNADSSAERKSSLTSLSITARRSIFGPAKRYRRVWSDNYSNLAEELVDPLTYPKSMYELSWAHAQEANAIDPRTGTIVDINPAAEQLSGYSRAELLGVPLILLAPQDERERVINELRETAHHPQRHVGFHLQRRDGICVPISISTSGAVELDGRFVIISEFRDITHQENYEKRHAAENWALSAFSGAALALYRARTEQELLQTICEAITKESAYALAYVSIAEEGREKLIRFAAKSGRAADYLDGMRLSWAEDDPDGQGPSGISIRRNDVYIVDDVEAEPSFDRWRERAKKSGIRSVVGIPLAIEGGWRGALVVFSAESNAFSAEPVQVFQRLGEQIVHGVEALCTAMALLPMARAAAFAASRLRSAKATRAPSRA